VNKVISLPSGCITTFVLFGQTDTHPAGGEKINKFKRQGVRHPLPFSSTPPLVLFSSIKIKLRLGSTWEKKKKGSGNVRVGREMGRKNCGKVFCLANFFLAVRARPWELRFGVKGRGGKIN